MRNARAFFSGECGERFDRHNTHLSRCLKEHEREVTEIGREEGGGERAVKKIYPIPKKIILIGIKT